MTPRPSLHDTTASIAFLRRWAPEGPWALTAIIPDGKTETVTFEASAWAKAATWIEERQGVKNIYFHVNPTRHALTSKASKEDVARLAWLHVDLDPRIGEDFEEEQKRALTLLQNYRIKPTVIVFSGGGYQGFWRLIDDERLEIGGSIARAQELEAYNIQLEKVFGADHCHNCDRIMRLPGTINVPNKKKLAKGRVSALAKVVEWNEVEYQITEFTPAPRKEAPSGTRMGLALSALEHGAGFGVDELTSWGRENGKVIDEITLALIATGEDPIDPIKYQSRSEVLFRVCCDLVRADVTDEVIYKVITGPNGIAGSVKEKPNWQAYALRQIQRAHDRAIAPELLEMNDQHSVLLQEGGKTRVLSWERTELDEDRKVPVLQSFDDFRNRYMHRFVETVTANGVALKPLGEWWLRQRRRREYLALRFYPGRPEEVDGCLNLWRGFTVQPAAGDWSLMKDHVYKVLANGNATHAEYILKWAAWAIQNPSEPAEVALVLRGGRGTGKGIFARALKRLFGQHGLQINSPAQLTGRFNAHLRDCCLLFADEAIVPGDKSAESVLKGLITEPELTIEGKGVNLVQARNRLHVVMASNESWVVPAGIDERRFAVFEVSSEHAQDDVYFKPLAQQLDHGGLAAMLHDLLTMDLDGWHPRRNVPQTDALLAQKAASLDGFDAYMFDMLSTDAIPITVTLTTGTDFIATEELRDAAVNWLKSRRGEQHVTNQKIAELMEALGCRRYRRGGGGQHGFRLQSLPSMRSKWDVARFPGLWRDIAEKGEEETAKPPF